MAIDPAELEGLDEDGIKALYEERLAQQRVASSREVTPPVNPALMRCYPKSLSASGIDIELRCNFASPSDEEL